MSKLLVCLLLICACLPVTAGEVRLHGANGDGGSCPDAIAADAVVQPRSKGKRAVVGAPGKAKPATFRGDDGNTGRAPRWHSFVPGMFR